MLGVQTIFLLIFIVLFLTFLILYVTSTGCTTVVSKYMLRQKMIPPAQASMGTNKKPLTMAKFPAPDNLADLEATALANFTVSRFHYGPADKKPFLTIVTRTCPGREALLQRNIDLCSQMIDKDFEHVILSDQKTSGMLIAETALYAFRNEYRGDYICHLDDDDYLCNFYFVDIMKKSAGTAVIISKAWSVDQKRELPSVWEQFPVEGEICTSNVLVRKDIYLANIQAISKAWAGDYTFMHNALLDAKESIVWVDNVFFYIGRGPLQIRQEYITVDLQGGLGNQMFQMATAYAYAQKYGKSLVFDHSVKVISPDAGVPRKSYFDTMFQQTGNADVKSLFWNVYQESEFPYHEIPYLYGNVQLKGYFQTAKYFNEFRSEILKFFQNENKAVGPTLITTSFPTVSLHIRRTDYITSSDLHTNQGMNYYVAAVKALKIPKLQIRVFSDDLKWCQQNLPAYFPEHELLYMTGSDEEDLWNMSLCDHHILANSSFSWWGSYLDTKQTAITVAPKIWFNDSKMNWQDIYCEKWIVL